MLAYKYDENFMYVPGEEIELEETSETPIGYTLTSPSDGLYKAKYNIKKDTWTEIASQDYINSLQPPKITHGIQYLTKQHADLIFILMEKGVI
ncbi:hypothetical protein P9173_09240 [Bacillus safensis]|uniref:hypothetical protein n=1 Tax=Bacillus TaxID=1386 RepID=UPI00227F0CBF|nr:hypothetical protein [Bacillus safensis]MCY7542515.1 hypothetical protein [Bacillus safensis]MCY7552390.1 hypothetical protein [Bacillus safensis]MCY7644821.1 hypothetical protein [Bacillus safensis]MCY7655864.1 hypothetical protein [Bacillus safensis]MEC3710338.1 hypothetical protein [Bacillus safensis]